MTTLTNPTGLAFALLSRKVTKVRLSGYGLGYPDFEHITDLAGPNWERSRSQVVADIERGYQYYVDNDMGPRASLEVMPPKTILGGKYVRTRPDCSRANNLLSLPRF